MSRAKPGLQRRTAVQAGLTAPLLAGLGGCAIAVPNSEGSNEPVEGAPAAVHHPSSNQAQADALGAGLAWPNAESVLPPREWPPEPPREMRAAWVATVANIDWPSKPGLSAAQMQQEAIAMLDKAQALGLNALVLQVRPSGDAIYPSRLEPWAEYLSGEQGKAPWHPGEAPWDPLAFWVSQAHRRGLALHAWFNPYRSRHSLAKSPVVAPHLAATRPELVRRYGEQLWMDPGEPQAAAHSLAVVADVLRRYDVDGVHMDDYFYPYPVQVEGVEQPFPDDEAWARAQAAAAAPGTAPASGPAPAPAPALAPAPAPTPTPAPSNPAPAPVALSRENWRRGNVNRFVKALYEQVKAIKPWVHVGISPFGLPRPDKRPPGIAGFSQYDKLYADVELWLEQGWMDYLAPQLYWPIERTAQAFPVLLTVWAQANAARTAASGGPRHLWPGLYTSLVKSDPPPTNLGDNAAARHWPAREVLAQLELLRRREAVPASPVATGLVSPQASGHIHFSMVALMQDRDSLSTTLSQGPYAVRALVPATPWLGGAAPAAPRLERLPASPGRPAMLRLVAPGPGAAASAAATGLAHVVWHRKRSAAPAPGQAQGPWYWQFLPAGERLWALPEGADAVAVAALSRTGVLGQAAIGRW